MTIEELLALMEDDGTDETWNIVMVVLPKIFWYGLSLLLLPQRLCL